MAQIEKSNISRNDPVDPSSRSSRQSRVTIRGARPFRTHLYDSLTEIRESALATEEQTGPTMEDDQHQFLGKYGSSSLSSSIEVDQVDTTCAADVATAAAAAAAAASVTTEDRQSRNSSPVNQKRSSQQADLVHSSQDCDDGDHVCRHKKMSKMKVLVRSHALREAASPPPDSPCASSPLFGATANDSPSADQQQQQHNQQPQASLVITVVESNDDASSHPQEMAQVANRLRPRVQVESSQCSVDSSSSFVSFSLSRDSSTELANGGSGDVYITLGSHLYTDNTGVDLQHFIVETLHRNYKDRMTLLRIEQDMIALVRDAKRTCHRFPAMSSYHRMLVHRVAAYFGMEHNVDQSGNCVVVSKSRHTRLPDVAFKEYVRDDIVLPEEPNRKLNPKRETVSFDEPHSGSSSSKLYCRSPAEARSRSLEERDVGVDVQRPRNRAFQQAQVTWVSSPDETTETVSMGARSKENLSDYATPTTSRNSGIEEIQNLRWPKRLSQGTVRNNRIPKVESFDSRDLLCSYGNGLRPTVAKSYSFGGYTAGSDEAAMRDESAANGVASIYQQQQQQQQILNQQNYGPRFLSKQDSNSSSISISRSSPTSSGYKSQQSAAPSPTPLPNGRMPALRAHTTASCNSNCSVESGYQEWNRPAAAATTTTVTAPNAAATGTNAEIVSATPTNTTLLWAVTSLDAVPPGSILINPQTGQPFFNPDGSAYRYDPQLPLPFQVEGGVAEQSNETEMEQAETYESYERSEAVIKAEESQEPPTVVSSVPVYPNWAPQHCYESPVSPTTTAHYVNQPQPYFSPEFASFHSTNAAVAAGPSNGYFVGPAASASFDDHMKGNCSVAVPVAHGHGYVLYQACLGPPSDNGQQSIDANDLYSAMKNLSLRPIGGVPPMSYPTNLADSLAHQVEMAAASSGPFMTAVPLRPANMSNGKMQATLPARSGSTPPAVTSAAAPSASLASNAYLASIRVQSNGQMMHHQVQPYNGAPNLVAPYHPMVYPLVNTGSHPQVGRQHYFPSSLVQPFNNAQYVSTPWSLVTASSATNRIGTPDRGDAASVVNVDMPTARMVAAPHSQSNQRLSCLYGPSLPSPFLTGGDCGGMRHSPTVLHRQFSLPNPAPPAMYTLRPRIQQQHQLPMPGSSQRPVTVSSFQNQQQQQQQQGALGFASRQVRTRRQVFRPHLAAGYTTVTDPSSVMPLHQSCSSSPVQQFPSTTS